MTSRADPNQTSPCLGADDMLKDIDENEQESLFDRSGDIRFSISVKPEERLISSYILYRFLLHGFGRFHSRKVVLETQLLGKT